MKSLSTSSQHQILSSQNQLIPGNQLYSQMNTQISNGSNSVKITHNGPDDDIMNYETLITKLSKGSISDKAIAIKKLLFLYQHSRARIYLYERRIVESLELCLLIQEKQISLSALSLLQKILSNVSAQSQIGSIFKKKFLSKVVLNLGSVDINIRKISHKSISEYIRRFKDYQSVIQNYLKTALKPQNQSSTKHLKLKSINSLHSLLMTEGKLFRMDQPYALQLVEQLISSSYQKEFVEIRRAALICLICVLKIAGSQNALKQISMKAQNQLYQLRMENEELASLLEVIMKYHTAKQSQAEDSQEEDEDQSRYSSQNAPSPKFISIQQSQVLIQKPPPPQDKINTISQSSEHQSLAELEPQPHQLKIFNQVSYAEEFLKKLEKFQFTAESLEQIKSFAPFLEKYLVDESIKLFSISKKIVEVIFDSVEDSLTQQTNQSAEQKTTKRKQVYIIVVPCVVKGIGNKRFIVRKNLDKLVRTYAKNHPQVWIYNFLDRFMKTQNVKIKEMLMDLFTYAYKTSPQFYYPVQKPFEIFDSQISNKNSTLRWKAIDCVVLMLERQGKEEASLQELLQKFSQDSYNKILRKLNKNAITIQLSGQQKSQMNPLERPLEIDIPSPVSAYKRKWRRNQRIITDQGQQNQKNLSVEKEQDTTQRHISQERKINLRKGLFFKQKQNRKSIIDYDLKNRRKTQKRSRQSKQRTSLQRLPELKVKTTANSHSLSKNEIPLPNFPESPVKKSFTEKNIMYIQKQQLEHFDDPKSELQKALNVIHNPQSSWMAHFDSINKVRAVVQNHCQIVDDEMLHSIVNEIVNCINGNARSGVMKISLICVDQLIRKMKKRLYPYTEMIMQALLKKSISTSEFMSDELKKCICISAEELCTAKIMPYITSLLKQSKSTEIKMNILLILQTMVKNDKIYKKQAEWIWMSLIDLHDEPQFHLRAECKNVVKMILELYKTTWKNDVISFKKSSLEKIDKILKNLNQKGENAWIQQENIEFQKILFSKGISSKYFAQQYQKIQQLDKLHQAKKNFKDRIKLINETFSLGFQYPEEFQSNLNIKKYLAILCDHLDQKNPGLLVNAVNIMTKCIDVLDVQDVIGIVLQKYVSVVDTKRVQLISIYQKLISKVYQKFDTTKILRQWSKVALVNSLKTKTEALNQIIMLLKQQESMGKKQDRLSLQNQRQRSKQKLKNKQNTIKELVIQTPNILPQSTKLTYPHMSQTPSNTSSTINIQSLNSQNLTRKDSLKRPSVGQSSLAVVTRLLNKLASDKQYENSTILNAKIKELIAVCNKKFGGEGKIGVGLAVSSASNEKLIDSGYD